MRNPSRLVCLVVALASSLAVAAPPVSQKLPDVAELKRSTARFAPVDLQVDLTKLPESERRALGKMVEAAQLMDALFLRQVWAGNEAMLLDLVDDATPLGRERLQAFLLNKSPWSRLDDDAPFIPGAPKKPEGGNFYPSDATRAELDAWMKGLPDAERTRAQGFFTVVRRTPQGKLSLVPYAVEYQNELQLSAQLLREAAALTTQPTLKAFLEKRADAFRSNDYYASDVAWMELDASVEPTIGPYETYEDGWFNYKAAFEAFITLRDDAETQKLQKFSAQLQDIENHLPIDPKLRNPKLGALAPIRVVNSLFSAGDANRGVQTAAFNLPNDERVAKEKGTKRVMLKNVQEAKFQRVLRPIAQVALSPADQKRVSFDAFFTHILMHELMHGLGPGELQLRGKKTTVRAELQELYSAIEEAKADISGLFALQHLIDKGVIEKSLEDSIYDTFLASSFRSIRFGIGAAHGRGQAMQLNYLLDQGAVTVSKDGTFQVNRARIKDAVRQLTGELMTLQANGDKARAAKMLELATLRPETQRVLDRLKDVPVDIRPNYVSAEKLLSELRRGGGGQAAGR